MKKSSQKAKEIRKILDVRGLSFVAERPIIEDIDWEVREGERWALLGANGSGKTSLISSICAYNTPSSGRMIVDGKEYSNYNWQKMREKIALVGSQIKRQFDKGESVVGVIVSGKFGQINFWGKMTRALVLEAYDKMKRLGIEYLIDSGWEYISQGERQKVLLARAMMIKPSVVFLDEPCTGLDPVARREFVKFLDRLCSDLSVPAVIMATHYVEEIPPAFTHAMILKGGRVLARGEICGVLTSENLSEAYGAKCVLRRRGGTYELLV